MESTPPMICRDKYPSHSYLNTFNKTSRLPCGHSERPTWTSTEDDQKLPISTPNILLGSGKQTWSELPQSWYSSHKSNNLMRNAILPLPPSFQSGSLLVRTIFPDLSASVSLCFLDVHEKNMQYPLILIYNSFSETNGNIWPSSIH